jgi:transposase
LKVTQEEVEALIKKAKKCLDEEKMLSPESLSTMKRVLETTTELLGRVNLNSQNSSKPPSTDQTNLSKKGARKPSNNASGGQTGHPGSTLRKMKKPDKVVTIKVDPKTLPKDKSQYHEVGVETRQVIDIKFSRHVIEYQAQILEDAQGRRFVAPFPSEVTKAVQYGKTLKAHAVYLSQHQLIPYARIKEYFADQVKLPLSEGSINNFIRQAYRQLEDFETLSKQKLTQSAVNHADETSINIGGKTHWLHCTTNPQWTHYFPHEKHGTLAINEAGILPTFKGTLCHDHWKAYYQYECLHALCNAHHLRELTRAEEQDKQVWAVELKRWLLRALKIVKAANGALPKETINTLKVEYQTLLKKAEIECPPPQPSLPEKRKRGRLKRSRPRNLLERFITYQDDVLRFMADPRVPSTNNNGERDIRMTKVHQKLPGASGACPMRKCFVVFAAIFQPVGSSR